MSVFEQDRVAITVTVLADSSTDWCQCTIEARGVDPSHLLALDVQHPIALSELAAHCPSLLLRILEILRAEMPAGTLRGVDEQTF